MESIMKKKHALGAAAALFVSAAAILASEYPVQAAGSRMTMYQEMSIGPVDVGGMTKAEAEQAVSAYVEELRTRRITLVLPGDGEKRAEAAAGDMGFAWANTDVLEGIGTMSSGGNIIRRYKRMKDMENTQLSLDIEYCVDDAMIQAVIEASLPLLEEEATDAVLTKTEGGFTVTPEKAGRTADVAASVALIREYLLNQWSYEDCIIQLAETPLAPKLTRAECEKVETEPMGEFVTAYHSSSSSRSGNIDAAVSKINGTVLLPGERFSCLEHMIPFTAENGYFPAGSYLNGKLVDSFGGGVCQVSTTLYNAVLLAELEVNQRNNHGLTVGYVQLSADAAIAESSGMDFIFTNNTQAPVYIEGFTRNKEVTFRIYGMDERPDNRTIKYKNTVVEVLNPPEDVVTEDPALAAGVTQVTQSSHTGYRAELYKYVYIDGTEVSRERINTSYYAPAPNYVSVGPGTAVAEGETEETPAVPEGSEENIPADAALEGSLPPENQMPAEGTAAEVPPDALSYHGPETLDGNAPSMR